MKTTLLLAFLFSILTYSQGPSNIATVNRKLWTLPINSSTDFDVASKMEMLVFIEAFQEIDQLSDADLFKKTEVKDASSDAVKKWKKQTQNRLLENFKQLDEKSLKELVKIPSQYHFSDLIIISKGLDKILPQNLKDWKANAHLFYKNYILECLRLAAKSKKRTSEIDTLDSTEINGFEQKEKSFLLTFDDGPSPENGNTDKLISVLKDQQLSGIFFLLGDQLKKRIEMDGKNSISNLYGDNWIGSHSSVHQSHQYMTDWKSSIDTSSELMRKTFDFSGKTFYFRPPYGQRSLQMTQYLLKNNQPTMLWNIDSQDWSSKINSQEVASRVITLMLLWRKGILLFHDVHPKAATAVPLIKDYFKNCDVKWLKPSDLN